MIFRALADLLVVLHFAFVLFVVAGGLLVLRWRRLAWLHLPVAAWGAAISFLGWVCPLTPLENMMRRLGGEVGYDSSFVDHYLVPVLYPIGLTRAHQVVLGLLVLAINFAVYGWLLGRQAVGNARDREGHDPDAGERSGDGERHDPDAGERRGDGERHDPDAGERRRDVE